jgi:hypothetical protein
MLGRTSRSRLPGRRSKKGRCTAHLRPASRKMRAIFLCHAAGNASRALASKPSSGVQFSGQEEIEIMRMLLDVAQGQVGEGHAQGAVCSLAMSQESKSPGRKVMVREFPHPAEVLPRSRLWLCARLVRRGRGSFLLAAISRSRDVGDGLPSQVVRLDGLVRS